jgi:hypothetical protein
VYIRDIAHGLADLAEKNDLDFIARLYRMAEMETQQLGGLDADVAVPGCNVRPPQQVAYADQV